MADFGRLFAKDQAREEEGRNPATTAAAASDAPRLTPEAVPTECLLYGYAGKAAEWKVLSKFEKIVAPDYICEDYPREDPNLFLSNNSPRGFSRSAVVVHKGLSRDALRKSRVYKGGQHWIKVTFNSYQAAERACFFSPVEIDGYLVHVEMWQGRGPQADIPIAKGLDTGALIQRNDSRKARTLSASQSANFLSGKDSAIAGFERALQTLPRSTALPDAQYGQPQNPEESPSSTTVSSATATDMAPTGSGLRSRSVPQLPSQKVSDPSSEYMTHIPTVKKAVLRPVHEALLPQPSFTEKVLLSLPIVSWFVGTKGKGDMIGDGPVLREDGTWDPSNGLYWSFWYGVDSWLGTDFCGLKED